MESVPEKDLDGLSYINCVNLACASNGGNNYGALAEKFKLIEKATPEVKPASKNMYEILVPTMHRLTNKPISVKFHRVWDKKVYEISGGITIMPPTRGKRVCNEGNLYDERMIPVRIVCTASEMEEIIKMTMSYYDQLAVLAYKLSDEVLYVRLV